MVFNDFNGFLIPPTASSNPSLSHNITSKDLDAPQDLEARETTETTMTLVWKRPRAKISNYRLAFVSTDGKRKEVEVPPAATTYTRKNLVPGMEYNITLVAERGRRKSAPTSLTASTGK